MPNTPSLGHILIVDDDQNISSLLSVNLKSEGYSVEVVDIAENVDRSAQAETSLVIVDAMRQPYSGMDLIYDFKEDPQTEQIAIILCSGFKSERMVIDALDAGADDYIVKPFSLRELVARVKSILRRHSSSTPRTGNIIVFHNMTVELTSQTVKIDNTPLALSKTEYAILVLLLKNVSNYVSRIEIHRKVWSDDTAGLNERIVDTNISRLRKKLGELGTHIVNRSGHGYMIS
ncbi:MAG: response regulator transcription factor [Muribaculaceae bacterium]|nr:response regulator transcription factor [Muribaculaceae bacterium]